MIIYLGLPLPASSSDLPESTTGRRIAFCSVLLRMGFTCAPAVTGRAVGSYPAFPPLPANAGGLFLLHWPGSHLHRTLSGILPCEARTFLTCGLSALAGAIICAAQIISLNMKSTTTDKLSEYRIIRHISASRTYKIIQEF